MKITRSAENGIVTLRPEGWLDTVSSPELGEEVRKITEATAIVLDFNQIEYMASAGLRQVLASYQQAKSMGASFSIINVSTKVMSIFKMTDFDKKLDIQPK